jgi:hypothetical protein
VYGEQLVVLLGRQELQARTANSARISSAITPPSMKNTSEVTRYIWPINL